MPLYQCRCKKCGNEQEIFRPMKDFDKMPDCCGTKMTKVLTAPHVIGDLKEYLSPIDGSIINSRSDHRDHMKRHGVVEMGNENPQPKKEIPKVPGLKQDIYNAIKQVEQRNS